MIKWTNPTAPKLLENTFVEGKNKILNRFTINNTYIIVKKKEFKAPLHPTSIPWKFLKTCRLKGYYRYYIKGAINKRAITTMWAGRVVFYDYERPFPRDLKRNDLLVLDNKGKQKIPKTRAAILDVVRR
jgi:hypothetical protein